MVKRVNFKLYSKIAVLCIKFVVEMPFEETTLGSMKIFI
jgi:hypothetical protein